MIYLFRACEAFGWHTVRCCHSTCNCLEACYDGFLDFWQRTCGACCSNACTLAMSPLKKPLAGYIVLALILGIPVVAFGIADLSHGDEKCWRISSCFIALGILHIASALYLQERLSQGLTNDDSSHLMEEGASESLATRALNVMMYDVGFCMYMPLSLFSFCLGCWAAGQTSDCIVWPGPFVSSILLVVFGCCASMYMTCWACIVSCCGFGRHVIGGFSKPQQMPIPQQYGSQILRMPQQKSHGHGQPQAPVEVVQPIPPKSR